MNMDQLSMVRHGDIDSLKGFILENGMQHKTFAETLMDQGILTAQFPIMDANPNDLDDWLLAHQVMHQSLAAELNLGNPVNLLDSNWNDESSFYDWLSTHLSLHQQILATLGL